jgi:hypothetical protein
MILPEVVFLQNKQPPLPEGCREDIPEGHRDSVAKAHPPEVGGHGSMAPWVCIVLEEQLKNNYFSSSGRTNARPNQQRISSEYSTVKVQKRAARKTHPPCHTGILVQMF